MTFGSSQEKYGAEMTTRAGDTTYGFNATADVTNDAMRFDPGEMDTIFTIWDAGGNDTLDLSGFYTPRSSTCAKVPTAAPAGWALTTRHWVGVDPSTITKEAYLAFVNANNTAEGLAASAPRPTTSTSAAARAPTKGFRGRTSSARTG